MTRFLNLTLSLALCTAAAQTWAGQKIPLFKRSDVLELTLQGNFPEVNKAKALQNKASPGQIIYTDKDSEGRDVQVTIPVELESRGALRAEVCDFGPMKIRLPQAAQGQPDPLKNTIFAHTHSSLRIVTHCDSKSARFQLRGDDWNTMVLIEQALYQILKATGFPALDTRLAHVKYLDAAGKPFTEGYAILLENVGDFAQRTKTIEFSRDSREAPVFDPIAKIPLELSLMAIQSSADHYFNSTHNSFFVNFPLPDGKPDLHKGYQVPYDFMISPAYFPFDDNDIGVQNKFFAGTFQNYLTQNKTYEAEIKKWLSTLASNKDKVYQTLEKVPFPEGSKAKQRLLRFLNEMFLDLQNFQGQNP